MTTGPLGPPLIVGAGIGGLTLALALARRGVSSIIVERAPVLEETGAGVQLSPNASRVLDGLGLTAAIDRVAARPAGVDISDALSGRRLASFPLGATAERRWGAPYRVVHRADLQAALLEAVRDAGQTEIRLGAEALEVRETTDGISLRMSDSGGEHDHEAGWLVGADGLRSIVRRAVRLPTTPRPTGLLAWRATVAAESLGASVAADRVSVRLGPGAHLVIYPLRRGRLVNVVLIGAEGAAGPHELVRRWAQAARAPVDAVNDWTQWPLFDRAPDARMRRGKVALLGDAAHPALPTLAQGAAFAIEDAATLARLATAGGSDPLGAYEAARLMRCARMQEGARRQLGLNHLPGLAARARNLALTAMPQRSLLGRLDWIYGWRDDSSEARPSHE